MVRETYDFVKATKRDLYWKARKEEIIFLIDSATGAIKKEYQDWVRCPICSGEEESLFSKEGFHFVRCLGCGLIFTNPQVKEEMLRKTYDGARSLDIWVDVLLTEESRKYDYGKYNRRLEKFEELVGTGRVLDIGCSIGHFLKLARDRGWQGVGLEMNAKAVKYATEELRVTVIPKLLKEANLPERSFDVVTLWGVIEHLKDPVDVLKDTHRILKDDGVLFIFCPNVESLVCRILRQHVSTFDGRNHLWYFAETTLRKLLDKTCFTIIEAETEQPELDTILNFLNYDDPYLKHEKTNNQLKDMLSESAKASLEEYIFTHNLGYKIGVYARKNQTT